MSTHSEGYANGRNVLPRDVLHLVQSHFAGGLLWVPPREVRRDKTEGHENRNRQIALEKGAGATTRDLARRFGLSPERIRQIVKRTQTAN